METSVNDSAGGLLETNTELGEEENFRVIVSNVSTLKAITAI